MVSVGIGVDSSGGYTAPLPRTPRTRLVRIVGRVPSEGLEVEVESESFDGGASVVTVVELELDA